MSSFLKKVAVLGAVLIFAFLLLLQGTRSSTFAVETALEIKQPAASIWQALLEAEQWPTWWPGLLQARPPADWQEGALLQLHFEGDPQREPAKVQTVLEQRELTWSRAGVLGSTSLTRWRLQSAPGGTHVRLESAIHGSQAFLARFTGRDQFDQYHQAVLASLRARLQTSSAAGEKS